MDESDVRLGLRLEDGFVEALEADESAGVEELLDTDDDDPEEFPDTDELDCELSDTEESLERDDWLERDEALDPGDSDEIDEPALDDCGLALDSDADVCDEPDVAELSELPPLEREESDVVWLLALDVGGSLEALSDGKLGHDPVEEVDPNELEEGIGPTELNELALLSLEREDVSLEDDGVSLDDDGGT